ncbi:MAG: hypothetical protein Q9170_005862 [Blastenia crenularia]
MFDPVPQTSSIYRRRHAIKPDEANFLVNNLPTFSFDRPNQASLYNAIHQHHVEGDSPVMSMPGIVDSSTSQSLQAGTIPRTFLSSSQPQSNSLNKDKKSNAAAKASTGTRPDHKRKFSALSEDEGDSDSSSTAVDIIHPSEIRPKEQGLGCTGIDFGEHYSPKCSPLCPTFRAAGTILTQCDDGSYCCGLDQTACCDDGQGVTINHSNGQIAISGQITKSVAAATSAPSSSATDSTSNTRASTTISSAAAGGVATSPTLPSPTATSSDSSLSGGAKAGIAIGAVAGVALVGGLLYLLFRERRKRRALQGGPVPNEKPAWQQQQPPQATQGSFYPPQEMGTNERQDPKYQVRGEMEGQGRPQELPSER